MVVARIHVQREARAQALRLGVLRDTATEAAAHEVRADARHVGNVLTRAQDHRRTREGAQFDVLRDRGVAHPREKVDGAGNRHHPVDAEDVAEIGREVVRVDRENTVLGSHDITTVDTAVGTTPSHVGAQAEVQRRPVEPPLIATRHGDGHQSNLQGHFGQVARNAAQIGLDDLVVRTRRSRVEDLTRANRSDDLTGAEALELVHHRLDDVLLLEQRHRIATHAADDDAVLVPDRDIAAVLELAHEFADGAVEVTERQDAVVEVRAARGLAISRIGLTLLDRIDTAFAVFDRRRAFDSYVGVAITESAAIVESVIKAIVAEPVVAEAVLLDTGPALHGIGYLLILRSRGEGSYLA